MRRILKFILVVVGIIVLGLASLRVAAHLRETQDRLASIPAIGRLVETTMGAVYVEEDGPATGPAILLVHGSVGWARFWYETSEALAAAGFRVIAFDLAPMGYSERAPNDYSRTRQAGRLLALVDAMDLRPALVAHSFGAGPATEAVMQSPGAFSSYIIVDGAIGIGSHDEARSLPLPLRAKWLREVAVSASITNPLALKPLLRAFLHRKEAATDAYLALLSEPMRLEGTTEALGDWLPTLLVPPQDALSTWPENYAQIKLPVGIIWGAEDTATPLSQGEEIRDLTPGAVLTVLPGLGHIPQIEDPKAFQNGLLDMLAKL